MKEDKQLALRVQKAADHLCDEIRDAHKEGLEVVVEVIGFKTVEDHAEMPIVAVKVSRPLL